MTPLKNPNTNARRMMTNTFSSSFIQVYTDTLFNMSEFWGAKVRYFEKHITATEAGAMVKTILGPLGMGRRLRRRLLADGLIKINGRPAFLTERVHIGEIVTVDAPQEDPSQLDAENLPFQIAFEDHHLLVVEKPAGMLVHPSAKERTGTLASAVIYYMQQQGESYPFRPLHRLDRGTSGLLIIAKHKLALERMEKALKRREISRIYVAFAKGQIELSRQTVNAPIALLPGQTVKRGVLADGRSAVTHVQVLRSFPCQCATKVELRLETGRTHQIRVHMAYLGHPLLGDELYGRGAEFGLVRQALHAAKLTFVHPFTGREIKLESTLPADLLELEQTLLMAH